jgi:hypothetical protein
MENVPQPVIGSLIASGFPFQTAVAAVVAEVSSWKVLGEEIPWRDDHDADQFIDLVASNGLYIAVIECKKTTKETLTFLVPTTVVEKSTEVRSMYLEQIQDSTKRMELFCGTSDFAPGSCKSKFCVVSTSEAGKGNQRLLERDAQRAVQAADAYAVGYARTFKWQQVPEATRFFVPVLVTNAPLLIAQYNPSAVSLESGQFSTPPAAQVVPVDVVRFCKGFTAWRGKDTGERTVFVVRSTALTKFLSQLATVGQYSKEGRIQYQVK